MHQLALSADGLEISRSRGDRVKYNWVGRQWPEYWQAMLLQVPV